MRKWNILAKSLFLVILGMAIVVTPVYADTPLPDADPTVESIHVYRNLLETNDRLFVVYANIPYADTSGMEPVTKTFIWELVTSTGTVLGSTVGYAYFDLGYNYNVYSLYFAAADAIAWDPTPGYTMRLRGNPIQFDTPPVYNFPVNSADYSPFSESADNKAALATDILAIAEDLDIKWDLTPYSLINDDETGQTLSTLGQAFFRGAIYGIQALAPALFPLAVQNIEPGDREWDEAYVEDLDVQYEGTWVETAKAAGGALFGVEYDLLSLILLFIMCAGLVLGNVYLTNDAWNGLIDVSYVLVISAKISLIGLGYVALMAAIAIIYISARIWGLIRG